MRAALRKVVLAFVTFSSLCQAQPPDELLQRKCTACHGAERWALSGHTRPGWWWITARMRWINGAALDWGEQAAVVEKLSLRYPARPDEAFEEWTVAGIVLFFLLALPFRSFSRRFLQSSSTQATAAADPLLALAVERAAERVEPRMCQTRGYPERYARALAGALAQARRIAAAVPGPVELSPASYVGDPLVHALFASPEHIQQVLRTSEDMNDYVSARGRGEAYALLSMARREKTVLGMEARGDVLRRDVVQRVVFFTDHRFAGPAPTEAEARENLLWNMFDRFLERVAIGLQRLRDERSRLERDKALALAHLRSAGPVLRNALQVELDGLLGQLGETKDSLGLERTAEIFEVILSHPEDCLYLNDQSLTLDGMGVVQAESAGTTALRFVELIERYQVPRTVVLAHCPELVPPLPMKARLAEAGKWLN